MPQIISCPDCSRKLRVPDNLLGKKVKCPSCGVKFVGEAEVLDELEEVDEHASPSSRRRRDERIAAKPSKSRRPEDEEDDEDDVPSRRRRREEESNDDDEAAPQKRQPKKREIYKGWERVLFGLNLVAIAVWIGVGARVVFFIATLILSSSASAAMASGTGVAPGIQSLAGVILGLAALADFACIGVQTTGFGFCMGVVATPRTLILKVLAVVMFCMAALGVIAALAFYGANAILGQRGALIAGGAAMAMVLLPFGEFICFLFFIRGIALVMRKEDLARAVVTFMIIIAACVGLFVVAIAILAFAGMVAMNTVAGSPASIPGSGHNAGGYAILTCGASLLTLGASIALLVRFMSLLYQTRSAVDRWLNRN